LHKYRAILFKFFRKNNTGFTLVEIIVSTIILSFIAAGMFSILVSGRFLIARAKMRLQAVEIARNFLERGRGYINWTAWSMPYGDFTDPNGNPFAPDAWNAAQPTKADWRDVPSSYYKIRYRVERGGEDVAAGRYKARKVSVQVRWGD
jgi:prepilin-type N-terminal cleavage/methylation domain-containing protein